METRDGETEDKGRCACNKCFTVAWLHYYYTSCIWIYNIVGCNNLKSFRQCIYRSVHQDKYTNWNLLFHPSMKFCIFERQKRGCNRLLFSNYSWSVQNNCTDNCPWLMENCLWQMVQLGFISSVFQQLMLLFPLWSFIFVGVSFLFFFLLFFDVGVCLSACRPGSIRHGVLELVHSRSIIKTLPALFIVQWAQHSRRGSTSHWLTRWMRQQAQSELHCFMIEITLALIKKIEKYYTKRSPYQFNQRHVL